jgi:c-di-GMP-binding flagellar brake protein YcgR
MARMEEKRRYGRYSIKVSGKASDDGDQNCKIIVNDISAGGMNITTDKELAEESAVTLQLDMPQLILPRTKQLQGFVVRKNEESSAYNYGLSFFGLSKRETEEIDASLRDGHFAALAHLVDNPGDENKKEEKK